MPNPIRPRGALNNGSSIQNNQRWCTNYKFIGGVLSTIGAVSYGKGQMDSYQNSKEVFRDSFTHEIVTCSNSNASSPLGESIESPIRFLKKYSNMIHQIDKECNKLELTCGAYYDSLNIDSTQVVSILASENSLSKESKEFLNWIKDDSKTSPNWLFSTQYSFNKRDRYISGQFHVDSSISSSFVHIDVLSISSDISQATLLADTNDVSSCEFYINQEKQGEITPYKLHHQNYMTLGGNAQCFLKSGYEVKTVNPKAWCDLNNVKVIHGRPHTSYHNPSIIIKRIGFRSLSNMVYKIANGITHLGWIAVYKITGN